MNATDVLVGLVLIVSVVVLVWLVAARVSLLGRATSRTAARDERPRERRMPGSLESPRKPIQNVPRGWAVEDLDLPDRLQYEIGLLAEAGYRVRQWLLSTDDAMIEVQAPLPKLDTFGQLRSLDGREHSVAILLLLQAGFPNQAPQVASGVRVLEADGSFGPEEEVEVRSAALENWQPSTSLAQIAAEVIASAETAPAAHPTHSLFDEFGQIRGTAGGSRVSP